MDGGAHAPERRPMAKSTALLDQADHRNLQQLVASINDGVILV